VIDTYHLAKVYTRGVYALRDVSVHVGKGEFVFLTGPSGAGKSTLLRLLLRQDLPTDGQLLVNGKSLASMSLGEVQDYRRTVGFVFQDFKLVDRRTVFENVTMVLRALGAPASVQRRRALQVLQGVQLQHRLDAFPPELSGGEQQRVAIARALVNEPQIVLADEPTGNLDPDLAREVMQLFRNINAGGTTVVVATHDVHLLKKVPDSLIMRLDKGRLSDPTGALRFPPRRPVAEL
jgi:cell division transport system ATP-binding protein